jgi:hypothetical protein
MNMWDVRGCVALARRILFGYHRSYSTQSVAHPRTKVQMVGIASVEGNDQRGGHIRLMTISTIAVGL